MDFTETVKFGASGGLTAWYPILQICRFGFMMLEKESVGNQAGTSRLSGSGR